MAIKFPPIPKSGSTTSIKVPTPKSPPAPKLPKSPPVPHLPNQHARPHEFRPTPLKPPKGPVAAKAAPSRCRRRKQNRSSGATLRQAIWSTPSDAWEK